ncbi:MAG: SRPBCC family protein, partial [Rhodospirillaceae bacterium]
MARAITTLLAAALGAAGFYYLDPQRGRRRRALARDRYASVRAQLTRSLEPIRRDAANRVQGLTARLKSTSEYAGAPDETVVQRVRSALGRCVSHPRAITVVVRAGRVELSGDILQSEHERLIEAVLAVPGVTGVDDALHVHATSEGVSALQGGRLRRGRRPELLRRTWGPATRAAVGTAGAVLGLYGLLGGRVVALGAGALMLVRSGANRPLSETLGAGGRGAIRIQKSIAVRAPVEKVYELLRNYDNFPRFMHNVRAVELRPDGTSHWTVAGPAGVSVEWDAITTDMEENRLIAWATTEGSAVDHAGVIRLVPEGDITRVHVTMTYTPIGGGVGHA